MNITEFLLARITEDETAAQRIQDELEREIATHHAGKIDERGPATPERILSGQLWAIFDVQTRNRNFAKGQYLATMAAPSRVLAECKAKRDIIKQHEDWPVLVEKAPEFANGSDVASMTMRMSQQVAWLTEREYVKKFGEAPPTAPMIRTLAAIYKEHPDYQKEWE